MSPYVACYEHYKARGKGDEFMALVSLYLQYGIVHQSDRVFVLARRVRHDAPENEIQDVTHVFPDPDTWFLAAFWGDVKELWKFEIPLEYVAWHKLHLSENVLHIYQTSVLSRFVPPT